MAVQREPTGVPAVANDLVDRLVASYAECGTPYHHLGCYELPSPLEVVGVLEGLRELIFPGFVGSGLPAPGGGAPGALHAAVAERLADVGTRLRRQIYRGLHHRCRLIGPREPGPPGGSRLPDELCPGCAALAEQITIKVLDRLPELRATLALDVSAAYEGDPAASGTDEIIFSYPGLYAISVYRIANLLFREGAHIIPRMLTEHAHQRSGVDIHPGATIGESFFIDHGTGIVIGETTVIGRRVRIYQGVTLGALSLPQGKARGLSGAKRHPTIEDDVIIYANATILGGDTVIGRGAVIGGNAWITRSVVPGTKLTVDGSTLGPLT
jgi:serine O-acetyltransferase